MTLFSLFRQNAARSGQREPYLRGPGQASSAPSRLRKALNRTRAFLATSFAVDPAGLVDDAYFETLVDSLVLADVGAGLAGELAGRIRQGLKDRGLVRKSDVPPVARDVLAGALMDVAKTPSLDPERLSVILLVGVNGSGKTTLAAKLAYRLRTEGRSVLLAAADTFRAAAIEQLKIWAVRAGADVVAGQEGADPASVVFDAVQAALSRHAEVLIVDTAGRLQTKRHLMDELAKITRAIDKACPDAQVVHLLVLDATVGQNALSQAVLFNECCPLTGLALAKMDGTAKGGAVFAVVDRLKVPLLYLGVGEGLDDLLDFDAEEFAAGLVPDQM